MKRLPVFLLAAVLSPVVAFAQAPGTQAPGTQAPDTQAPDTAAPPSAQPQKEPSKEEVQAFEKELMGQFQKADNYDIKGRVGQIDLQAGAMVVTRESLPPVLLVAPESVPVKINGKKASLSDLQVGSDVRATFNISQNFPIALSLDAKAPKEQQAPTGAQPEKK